MKENKSIDILINEYKTIFNGKNNSMDALKKQLIREADWSDQAAISLLGLAEKYGAFMLRNALAISLALEIEDGELGF